MMSLTEYLDTIPQGRLGIIAMKGGEELIGKFVNARITGSSTWSLYGEAE